MNTPRTYSNKQSLATSISSVKPRPGLLFGVIILTALLAFEIFNFSTTDFALKDLLGDLTFAGIHWATILSIAFCGIDFAGIARLFAPDQGDEQKEVWYLFGAWFLAATMNAVLTWWGVSMAITNHQLRSTTVVDPSTLISVVPIFVSLMVWVIRILIIGSLSLASEQLFGIKRTRQTSYQSMPGQTRSFTSRPTSTSVAASSNRVPNAVPSVAAAPRPGSHRPIHPVQDTALSSKPEPSYHSLTRTARPAYRPENGKDNSGPTRQL